MKKKGWLGVVVFTVAARVFGLFFLASAMPEAPAQVVRFPAQVEVVSASADAFTCDLTFDLTGDYLPALKSLESEQVAVADVWSMSEYILQTKRYSDISGNHINHPNDFMVRIYAQVTGALLDP
jgi:hypothetical protein